MASGRIIRRIPPRYSCLPPSRQLPHSRHGLQSDVVHSAPASALDSGSGRFQINGSQHAMYSGMLRITLPSPDKPKVVTLEGRLTGLWAQELLRVARDASAGTVFDLQEVFYVDSAGEVVLRTLGRSGAAFITDSAYGKDLCKRLKLRRVSGPQISGEDAAFAEQIPEISNADGSSSGLLGPQRSRCRE